MGMKREWKPGDVAMTRYGRAFYSGDEIRGSWTFDDGSGGFGPNFKPLQVDEPADTRPLVVIDPEDREQVERLAAAWDALSEINFPLGDVPLTLRGYRMQAALREFADPKPPKPEEPTGLGAVVEDAEGVPWVRCENVEREPHWYARSKACQYAEIAAVRVLSDGVQP